MLAVSNVFVFSIKHSRTGMSMVYMKFVEPQATTMTILWDTCQASLKADLREKQQQEDWFRSFLAQVPSPIDK